MKDIPKIKILEVYPVEAYQLEILFSNNEIHVVDFLPVLNYTAFSHLKDPEKFKQFALIDGTIQWKDHADLAPEFIYKLAKNKITALSQ